MQACLAAEGSPNGPDLAVGLQQLRAQVVRLLRQVYENRLQQAVKVHWSS